MGIWVVGPVPDLGQCMSIDTHVLTALFHPHQIDKDASVLDKRFARNCFKYDVPDPECFVQLGMYEEYCEVQQTWQIFSGMLPLSETMRPQLTCVVRAYRDIKYITRRCPGAGPFCPNRQHDGVGVGRRKRVAQKERSRVTKAGGRVLRR